MSATNAANPIAVPSLPRARWLTPTRLVSALATLTAFVVVLLWGAIAMQGPPGNPYGPPQGGGYGAPPENPYGGPAPGPREAPPPEVPVVPPPEPPTGSGGASSCDLSGCDACGPCGEVLGSLACDGLCEVLSLCEIFSACSSSGVRARAGFVAIAFGELLLPIAVLAAWRKRERRRERAA
jgi:hypothetical protein